MVTTCFSLSHVPLILSLDGYRIPTAYGIQYTYPSIDGMRYEIPDVGSRCGVQNGVQDLGSKIGYPSEVSI